jgi:hypothetical protein
MDRSSIVPFRKNEPKTVPLRSGEKAPNFQLPSVQGGLFRLDMRTAHGPVVLAFVDAGDGGRELLEHLKEHEGDFQRVGGAGAYYHPRSNPETRTTGRPYSSIGPTMAATVAVIVRAETMESVRELRERLKLPYYVLWDEASRVSRRYGVAEGEIAAAVVQTEGTLTWFSESVESLRVEQILRAILPGRDEDPGPEG